MGRFTKIHLKKKTDKNSKNIKWKKQQLIKKNKIKMP